MGWFEGFGGAVVGVIKKAIAAVVLLIILAALIHWGQNNSGQAQATSDKVMGAAASGIGWAADGFTNLTGGSAAEAEGTGGPKIVMVENTAPAGWSVGRAIRVWNKGLTSVKLKAGECVQGLPCIHVSQVKYLAPDPATGQVTLGRTSRFLGTSVKFNGSAVGHVPATDFPVASCHELGHALGLGHSAVRSSCMFPSVGAAVSSRPDRADYAAVNAKYGH